MKVTKRISRRDFVQTTMLGGLASLLPFKGKGLAKTVADDPREIKVQFRSLGKTGLQVSTIGFGAMTTSDPTVVHHALDLGINYIDTAASYMRGNNEIMVGNVLKTRRKDTFIATKIKLSSEAEMMESVQTSLRKLQTDVIDVIQLHGLNTKGKVLNEEAMNALDKMRKKGMVRFLGFSTHDNQPECLLTAIEAKFYDMVLVSYNFTSDPAIGEAIKKAGEAGIGIVAMKTQAGGYRGKDLGDWSPHQAALRWVLKNSYVSTTIPGMTSFAQVDENFGAMKSAYGFKDEKVLQRYVNLYNKEICRMCGSCRKMCPYGLPIQDINRCLMYAEGYRNFDLALQTYKEISKKSRIIACDECEACQVQCKYHLNIPERLNHAREIFGSVNV
jgi:predicted aldo/keto reductase-like oxidoreductase